MLRWLAIAFILLAWQRPGLAADEAGVSHELSFAGKNNQYVHVRSTFEVTATPYDLHLPSWAPGSYLIRDFATNLERLSARDAAGFPLVVKKVAKNHWQIESGAAGSLTVEYDVWAGRRNVSESWVESEFGLINGAGIFLYNEQSRGQIQDLSVVLPDSWASLHTSLSRTGDDNTFRARDFDELVDSPILAGNTLEFEFEVENQPYSLVLSRQNRFWEGQRSADDVAEIVRAQQEFWGVNPFDRRYLFLNLYMDKFGGLEHDHSTVMMCSHWQMRGRKDYVKWLGLVSHEFFHSWNVRRMRPAALTQYDYSKETYTRELWLAEGITSYYDNLLLFRAGLIDVAVYFELLAEEFRNYETTPGRQARSAELASFDTWIKHYKQDSNKVNSTISYYGKGALIGFVTDTEIRRATANKASLDTVMREMYARYGPGGSVAGGYPRGAFEQVVESVAGTKVREVVEEMLTATTDPDIDGALSWYGLLLDRSGANGGAENKTGEIGVKWRISGAALYAEHVLIGHPAASAGVLPEDELLAINGLRVTPDTYQGYLLKLAAEEEIDLTLVRDGRLMTLSMVTGPEVPVSYLITTEPRINSREQKRIEVWLGRDLKFLR